VFFVDRNGKFWWLSSTDPHSLDRPQYVSLEERQRDAKDLAELQAKVDALERALKIKGNQ
jgi:hypothetical protein